jgi:autotransporter-associated beta strand protein
MKRSKIHSIVPSGRSLSALGKIVLPACGLALAATPMAHAASDTWTGATDGTWATTSNWNPSVAVPGTGDTATFNAASSNTTINLGSGVTLGTLLFDTSSAAAYTIGSGAVGSQTLTLGTLAGGVQMNSTVAANQLINANLALSTTGTYTVGLTNNSTTNTLTVAGGISASTSGAKVLTVTGSGNTTISGAITSGTGTVGLSKSGSGTLTLSNAGTSTIASNFQMAGGLVQITAGTINVTENSGNNTGLRTGANLTVSGGTLNLSGASSWFPIGDTNGQTSTLTVSGGTVNVTNNFGTEVGRNGNGVLTITSGTFKNADTGNIGLAMGDNSATAIGTINLNGGTLIANKIVKGTGGTISTGNKFYFNGGTLSTTGANTTTFFAATTNIDTEVRNGGGTIDTAGFSATIADNIVHSTVGGDNATDGGITKIGTGTLTLSGANTYNGATTISAGKLSVTGSITAAGSTGGVALSGGTTTSLEGTGTLSGLVTVTNASRIAPGVNTSGTNTNFGVAGTLNLTGGLTLTSANLDFDLAATAAGTSDKLALNTGALTFGTINFTFNGLGGTLETGTAYTLITTTGSATGFNANNISTTFSGALAGNYSAAYSLSGSNLQVTFTAVPEPREFAIAITFLLGALIFARRQARRCE